jgi:ParB family transcriptional regulator, chromosome partitioning protein
MNERKDRAPRLGRGLAALYGDLPDHAADGAATPQLISVTALAPGGFQPRQDMSPEGLDELASSIRVHGVLQPILVRPHPGRAGQFQIVAGERRWRAAQLAGLHEVPVHVRDLDEAAAVAAALIENLQRQDLNAMEEAEGLRRLADEFELSQDVLATNVGKSRSHIANMLRLLTLPASVQGDVRRGALSAGHARALLMHPDPAKAAMVVLARGLNVRQTEALARPSTPSAPIGEPTSAQFETAALERQLAARLGLRAKISFDGRGGQIVLGYRSLEQLEGLLRLLGVEGGD